MEICPQCRKSFPDGVLVNVFIVKDDQFTQQLMCTPCGMQATQGMHGLSIKPVAEKGPTRSNSAVGAVGLVGVLLMLAGIIFIVWKFLL